MPDQDESPSQIRAAQGELHPIREHTQRELKMLHPTTETLPSNPSGLRQMIPALIETLSVSHPVAKPAGFPHRECRANLLYVLEPVWRLARRTQPHTPVVGAVYRNLELRPPQQATTGEPDSRNPGICLLPS